MKYRFFASLNETNVIFIQKNIFFVFFLFAASLPEQDTNGIQASILDIFD